MRPPPVVTIRVAHPMDLLLRGGTVVTCDPSNRVFEGDVLLSEGRIRALGPDARREARGLTHVLDATGCAVMPGLVQAHVHLCQVLFRGMADDLPLLTWLRERIWPLEAAHDAASLRASADLGLVELIQGGTTTVLDMGTVHHHDAVFEALRDAGLRAVSGKTMMDAGRAVPAGLRERTDDSLGESEALCRRWHKSHGDRLRYAFSPRFILSCSKRLLAATAKLARAHGAMIHTHAAEHPDERAAVRAAMGGDDVDVLASLGIAGPDVVLAHGVQLTAAQRKKLARAGTRVCHCPSANLKLGSGVAKVAAMREAGIVVALGADGAPCNNNLDAWTEMRNAALLAKGDGDTTALPARTVLRMATIDGARALGLDGETGSLEVGKRADVIAVSLHGAHAEPGGGPEARLVYAARASDVRHVVVDGRVLMQFRTLHTLDERAVLARARDEAAKVAARAGVAVAP
jgi:5-methylthioadenosine/S-adenosylhomocysteine deaminase